MKKIHISLFALLMMSACSPTNESSDAYGTFEADRTLVSAMASGQLLFSAADEGRVMPEGMLAAIVDTTDYLLQLRRLESIVTATATRIEPIDAQAEVQQQQKENLLLDKERVERLIPDGAATRKQLDDINGAIRLIEKQYLATLSQKASVQAEIKSLEIQVQQAQEAIKKCYIHNPVQGTVLSKIAMPGEIVTFGKPVYSLANLSKLKLRVFVSGNQLAEIAIGQSVDVRVDNAEGGIKTYQGTITQIAENAEFTPKIIQTREERVKLVYAVIIEVENDGTLKIGMPGEVRFK